MDKVNTNLTSLDEILDRKYGKMGSARRETWEHKFEAFKLGVLLEEARKRLNLTQEDVAERCGTNKAYISRIENDASDIRLSTLIRVINKGFGGKVKLIMEI